MLTSAEIRLRLPSRVTKCSASQASQASVPWMRSRRGSWTTAERYPMVPSLQPADLADGVLAHLHGWLGELRQGLVLGDRDVADREDPVVPNDPEVRAGADAAAVCLWQAPAADRLWRGHPGRPYRDVAGQGGAVGE
jgi:hypothetical protein